MIDLAFAALILAGAVGAFLTRRRRHVSFTLFALIWAGWLGRDLADHAGAVHLAVDALGLAVAAVFLADALRHRRPTGQAPARPVIVDELIARLQADQVITTDGLPPFDPTRPVGPRNFPENATVRGGLRYGADR